jgi:hypothetical protein
VSQFRSYEFQLPLPVLDIAVGDFIIFSLGARRTKLENHHRGRREGKEENFSSRGFGKRNSSSRARRTAIQPM